MLSSIKRKTIAAFGLIILISAVITSVLLVNTAQIADTTTEFYEHPYTGMDQVWMLRRDFLDNQRALYKFLSAPEESREKAGKSLQTSLDKNNQELLDTLASLRVVAEGKGVDELFNRMDELQIQEAALQKEVMQLISSGRTDEAASIMRKSYEPIFEEITGNVLLLFDAANKDALSFIDSAQAGKQTAILIGILLTSAMVVISFILMALYLKALMRPLRQVSGVAQKMAHGDLSVTDQLTYYSEDEIGDLVRHQEEMSQKIAAYIAAISNTMSRLSQKDLQIESQNTFEGDFLEIQASVEKLVMVLNATLSEINSAANQVSSGATQIASAAQDLSQGTTEQAASIETLSLNVETISHQVQDTAQNAQKATRETDESGKEIALCSGKMLEMNEAMRQISQRANEISKIIKTIEDIAFQTNILALNAAVEAARAGVAGKGFAVVADEVRSLASKSAEASKSTSALIEGTIQAVENGGRIAQDTNDALENVVQSSRRVTEVVTSIAAASTEQAKAIEAASEVVQQISNVVQINSATAEESAAASEELSGQAELLRSLANQFKLLNMETVAPARQTE